MKRSSILVLICISAIGLAAQNMPSIIGGYAPFHQYIRTHKPPVYGEKDGNSNQLKQLVPFEASLRIAYLHNVNSPQGWMEVDSSTFIYGDSLTFPQSDTTLLYVAASQSWIYDSLFYATINPDSVLMATKTGQVWPTGGTGTPTNTWNYIYGYDNNNLLTTIIYQTWGGTAWTPVDSISILHDGDLRDSITASFTWNGSWQTDTQYLYAYNIQTQDSQIIVQIGNGTGWVNYLEYNYQYTPITNLFTGINISTWNSAWSPYATYNYTRNNSQATYLYQLTGSGQYLYEENYYYDYRNNVTVFERDSFTTSSTTIPVVQYTYNYDINNDLTFEEDASNFNGTLDSTDQYYYYYGQYGIKYAAINDVDNALGAVLFPNPSTGEANIQLNCDENSSLVISVYDATGRKVSDMNANATAGLNTLPLNVTQLAAGNYLVTLTDRKSGKSSALKFVKQ